MTKGLPKGMHLSHGRYYLVRANKWHPLSKNLHDALVEYARLTAGGSVGELADLVLRTISDLRHTVSPGTIKQYEGSSKKILKAFAQFSPAQIKPFHIAKFLDHHKGTPGAANTHRSFLANMFKRAVRWGIVETNPVRDIEQFKTNKRDRYITADEFTKIREHASPTLQAMMDISYILGQRIGDVMKIKYSDITEAGVFVRQQKTKERRMIEMTPDLAAAIARARSIHQSVKGLTLFHRRDGRPCSYYTIHRQWGSACTAAEVEDAHFHDIRAATATDAKTLGMDSKTLLGHTTEGSHNRYLRSKVTTVAKPVPGRNS